MGKWWAVKYYYKWQLRSGCLPRTYSDAKTEKNLSSLPAEDALSSSAKALNDIQLDLMWPSEKNMIGTTDWLTDWRLICVEFIIERYYFYMKAMSKFFIKNKF